MLVHKLVNLLMSAVILTLFCPPWRRHDASYGAALSWSRHTATRSYLIRPDSCNDLSLWDSIRKCKVYPLMSCYWHSVQWCFNIDNLKGDYLASKNAKGWVKDVSQVFCLDGDTVRSAIWPQTGRKLIEPDRWG